MGRKSIPEDEIAEWVLLKQKGQSFRSIAKAYQVDARTVQAWVRKAGEEKEKEHWEAVSRQVDADRLDEHYRLLLQAAASLMQAARIDPLSVSPDLRVESLVNAEIQSGIRQAAGILKSRGVDLNAPAGPNPKVIGAGESPALRLGQKLRQALFDHEPSLRTAFDEWGSRWTSFQQARQGLIEEAGNLFRQKKVPGKTSDKLKTTTVREALAKELLGTEARSTRLELGKDEEAVLVRFDGKIEEHVLTGTRAEMELVEGAYDDVLRQVSHQERMSPVKDAYRYVLESAQRIEGLVDQLILMGRPQGHCSLCPQYAAQPGKSRAKRVKQGGQRT